MRIHVISFPDLPWVKENIQTRRHGSSKKIPIERVMVKAKIFKETYGAKLEIPVGCKPENLTCNSMGVVWILSETTHYYTGTFVENCFWMLQVTCDVLFWGNQTSKGLYWLPNHTGPVLDWWPGICALLAQERKSCASFYVHLWEIDNKHNPKIWKKKTQLNLHQWPLIHFVPADSPYVHSYFNLPHNGNGQ